MMTKEKNLPTFGRNDVDVVEYHVTFKGHFSIGKYQVRHRLFEGGWSETYSREVFERGKAVMVLPYDPVRDQVVLIEQFRIGALNDKKSPWLLEIVAGMIDTDETPEQVAMRELQEEVGIDAESLLHVSTYWVTPGACSEEFIFFCAKVDASKASGVHGLDEENEDIRAYVFQAEEAFAMARDGTINNGSTILALQWLELNRGKIFIKD